MKEYTAYIDGQYVHCDQKFLEAFTPGRQKWRGVFETMRTVNGTIDFLDEHVQRIIQGLKVLKMRHPYTARKLKYIVQSIAKQNRSIKLGRLRIMIFENVKNFSFPNVFVGNPVHCIIMLLPYQPPPIKQYRQGLRVMVIKTNRPATARQANVKSLDYGLFARAYQKAKDQGYDEALLLNAQGHVFEASRANVFIWSQGRLITPPLASGCLNGIVRQQVIHAARQLKISVLEQNLTSRIIKAADHAFLTNSLLGLIPFQICRL